MKKTFIKHSLIAGATIFTMASVAVFAQTAIDTNIYNAVQNIMRTIYTDDGSAGGNVLVDINNDDGHIYIDQSVLAAPTNNNLYLGLNSNNEVTVISGGGGTVTLSGEQDHDWYQVGTTQAPMDINDDVYTYGKVGVGTNNPEHELDVRGNGQIGSGHYNIWGYFSSILGGIQNSINGDHSSIGGGRGNKVGNNQPSRSSFLGGGITNEIDGSADSFLGGGQNNTVRSSDYSFLGGGLANGIFDTNGGIVFAANTLVGGNGNTINSGSIRSFIGGGNQNRIWDGEHNVVVGGQENQAEGGNHLVVVGGQNNDIFNGNHNSIVGGQNNLVEGDFSSIGGGAENTISSVLSTIIGGSFNSIVNTTHSLIGGGQENLIDDAHESFIGNGRQNQIIGGSRSDGTYLSANDTILGGENNLIQYSQLSSILGGRQNLIRGYDDMEWNNLGPQMQLIMNLPSNGGNPLFHNNNILGEYNSIRGSYGSYIIGNNNINTGSRNIIIGGSNSNMGSHNRVFGDFMNIEGMHNYSLGLSQNITGTHNYFIGSQNSGSGHSNYNFGNRNSANGNYLTTIGVNAHAIGFGIGIINLDGTTPITGEQNGSFIVNAPSGVGINHTTPTQALDVNGNIKTQGTFVAPSNNAGITKTIKLNDYTGSECTMRIEAGIITDTNCPEA